MTADGASSDYEPSHSRGQPEDDQPDHDEEGQVGSPSLVEREVDQQLGGAERGKNRKCAATLEPLPGEEIPASTGIPNSDG